MYKVLPYTLYSLLFTADNVSHELHVNIVHVWLVVTLLIIMPHPNTKHQTHQHVKLTLITNY